MNYTPPEPTDFSDVPEHAHVWGFTEAQLRAEVERVRRETVEECVGFLSMSRDTFAANFGKSVDADWIYDDLNELMKELLK